MNPDIKLKIVEKHRVEFMADKIAEIIETIKPLAHYKALHKMKEPLKAIGVSYATEKSYPTGVNFKFYFKLPDQNQLEYVRLYGLTIDTLSDLVTSLENKLPWYVYSPRTVYEVPLKSFIEKQFEYEMKAEDVEPLKLQVIAMLNEAIKIVNGVHHA